MRLINNIKGEGTVGPMISVVNAPDLTFQMFCIYVKVTFILPGKFSVSVILVEKTNAYNSKL